MGKIYTAIFATLFGVSVLAALVGGVMWFAVTWLDFSSPTTLPLGWAAIGFFVMAHVFAFLMVLARNLSKPVAA
ncbi:hypothetical protein [Massilia oculi]|jgi:hypothetical protein|uniref:hypothetical protein n=1 Tax=Massilia oculi TaxID=945844 RepID=UPI001AAF8976|nr:hypothetical protein [Massilia oculi]